MNALGITLIWSALQATLFCLAGTALYFLARRRDPALGASTLCAVLAMAAALAGTAISPWPRWRILSDAGRAVSRSAMTALVEGNRVERSATSAPDVAAGSASPPERAAANESAIGMLSAFWNRVQRQVQSQWDYDSRETLAASGWRAPAWLALVMLSGAGVGLARMLVGILSLTRLLRDAAPVTDRALAEVLERLRAELGCRRPIELRELAGARGGGSPAVVGWRRPVILLPADWRSWNMETRRGILAHETAHVVHGDFLKGVAAQAGVILHFYNPLVHWLARRMRLEQELAADARGATLAGGAKTYAFVLAQMALQQDRSRPLWAGRPFFPTRGTLMRRIEMLENPGVIAKRKPSPFWPAALLTTLALVGIGVSGLRGAGGAMAYGAPTPADAPDSASGALIKTLPAFDRTYLPAETIAVISIKPLAVANSQIVTEPAFCVLPNAIAFGFGPLEQGKTRTFEVEELTAITLKCEPGAAAAANFPARMETAEVLIYRLRKPVEPGQLRENLLVLASDDVTETTCHGHKCFRVGSEETDKVIDYLMVDERTIVVLREKDAATVLAADAHAHPAWYAEWQRLAASPVAAALDSAVAGALDKESADAADRLLVAILKQTSALFASVESTPEGLKVSATAHCRSPKQAIAAGEAAQGAVAAALMAIPQLATPSSLPTEFQKVDVSGALSRTLSNLKLHVAETQIRAEATFGADFASQIVAAQKASLDAMAKETEQAHFVKLGRLAAAFNAYRAAHGHYPPAAVVGPDGKTPHSWRVELLPYLGEQKLFDSYQLDEPWDGEHNKQLIEQMPEVFSNRQSPKNGAAEYYVVTGQGTLFDGAEPATRESIADAPSETILVVQSHRRFAWTRPIDLSNDGEGEPSGLGQFGGFYAAFADGTVKFVPISVDAETIRAMLTKAGGDEVKLR